MGGIRWGILTLLLAIVQGSNSSPIPIFGWGSDPLPRSPRLQFNPFPVSSEEEVESETLQIGRRVSVASDPPGKNERILFPTDEDSPNLAVSPPQALKFLSQFGYLGSGPTSSAALFTKESVEEALVKVQKFGSIPETGKLDAQTLLTTPRCGNRDIGDEARRRRKRFIVGAKAWNKRNLRYYVGQYSDKLTNRSAIDQALATAFRAWSTYSNLRFIQTQTQAKADLVINFGRGSHGDRYPFDGPGYTLAHAFYPYEFGEFGGDIHFDDDEDWSAHYPESSEGVDFFTVAVHEIGHSLGLSHSPDQNSIMFPYYKGPEVADTFNIGYDDILAMYQLYNNPVEDEDGDRLLPSDPSASTTTTTTTSTTTLTTTTTTLDLDESDYQNDEPREPVIDTDTLTDLCSDPSFDSFGFIRGELYLFKGKMMWRYSSRGNLFPGYPVDFHQMFSVFPAEVDHIDTFYERPIDGSIVFFSGAQYWIYDGFQFIENTPLPLSYLGLPSDLKKLDATFVWGKNQKTYFFRNNLYWRFDERSRRIEDGYPWEIGLRWHGLPDDIQSVFTDQSGTTFFFKDERFMSFDDFQVQVEQIHPTTTAQFWFNCPA
eukprot:maker-scaffold761_size101412-snap-gene-0.18 protein:Tk08770 transcript:maker-scaffold761_size101412-snap-gene-0.18-mRNA-1 annotation:"matrix metalloproteinase-24"